MTHSARMLVLCTTRVGENALVVHTITDLWGRRSFLVNIGKKTSTALLQPMNVLDGEVVENPKSDLWRLKALHATYPLAGIRCDVRKNTMTLFISEVLYRTIREGGCEEGLLDWCEKSILTLDALQSDFPNYHLRWLLEFCGALGFLPSGADLLPFAGERLRELEKLLSLDFAQCLMYPLTGVVRNELAGILLDYIGFHTETRPHIRSLAVLRELYA